MPVPNDSADHDREERNHVRAFPRTRWSLIHLLQSPPEDEKRRLEAKNEICRSYWMPLYQLGMNLGLSTQDAEDATQNFFVRLLQGELWDKADGNKGKLRSFLAAAYRRHVIDAWRQQSAQKRGGGQAAVLLIEEDMQHHATMQKPFAAVHLAFERDWAKSLVNQALQRLESFYQQRGKISLYQALLPLLGIGPEDAMQQRSTQALEAATGLSGSSLRMALLRLRERFRQELLMIVEDTLAQPSKDEAMEELREILQIMQSHHER